MQGFDSAESRDRALTCNAGFQPAFAHSHIQVTIFSLRKSSFFSLFWVKKYAHLGENDLIQGIYPQPFKQEISNILMVMGNSTLWQWHGGMRVFKQIGWMEKPCRLEEGLSCPREAQLQQHAPRCVVFRVMACTEPVYAGLREGVSHYCFSGFRGEAPTPGIRDQVVSQLVHVVVALAGPESTASGKEAGIERERRPILNAV